jgi:predicted transglutaminase-like cysteine proteinase
MGMRRDGVIRTALGCAGLGCCIAQLLFHAPAAGQTSPVGRPMPWREQPDIVVTANAPPVKPDLFGTVALPARISRYADGWFQSRRDASSHPALQRLIAPARALSRDAQVAYVQEAVHAHIRWRSDATEWSAHDYWASASETLDRGAGDMEDRAILKLQALKALGFPGRDLYITMGRDKVGGPITVLLARVGKSFFVLDDTGGKPVPSELRTGFEPAMTFGANRSWLHGRRSARAGAAAAATTSVAVVK